MTATTSTENSTIGKNIPLHRVGQPDWQILESNESGRYPWFALACSAQVSRTDQLSAPRSSGSGSNRISMSRPVNLKRRLGKRTTIIASRMDTPAPRFPWTDSSVHSTINLDLRFAGDLLDRKDQHKPMNAPHGYIEKLAELTRAGAPFVAVTMVDAVGSTPQDAGSKMLASSAGLEFGTVGGGRVERKAIEQAQKMLKGQHDETTAFVEWNLQSDVGMTCGGTVRLFFECINHRLWHIVIFGAGHVAQSLTQLLVTLDCRVTCYDQRAEWLERMADWPQLATVLEADLPSRVAEIPDDAFVLCITMGHRTDRPILEEIFRRGRRFPYLGVIGSHGKRAVMKRELLAAGIPEEVANQFHCPIGLQLGTNQPGEIAVSIAAELIQERDRIKLTKERGNG